MPKEGKTITKEQRRLRQPSEGPVKPWRKWGPYVSERAWGTVREDYSPHGTAWDFFPHDLARSKAYRWGEDGIAGWCDRYQVLCFALALWNGRDPILKERLFGLVASETNHGEDGKEYYFYVDGTPTHSYMKYLYKYPQAAYPYSLLIEQSRGRPSSEGEYELLDTGVFDDDRYFDVFVEYAKGDAEDTCIRIEAFNRGPEDAPLHILPHLWFRNTWAWGAEPRPQPRISLGPQGKKHLSLLADDAEAGPVRHLPFDYQLGKRYLYAQPGAQPLFTDNETNGERVFGPGAQSRSRWVKDAFHRHVIHGEDCVNPDGARHQGLLPLRRAERPRRRLGGRAPAPDRPRAGGPAGEGRRDRGGAARRGGRVLRLDPAVRGQPGRAAGAETGVRRHAVGEADLPLQRPYLARGRQPELSAAGVAQVAPQRALAPPQLDARAVDARQVGVPVVRRLGPRFSDRHLRGDRSGIRQGAALASALRAVPASERTDPGVRVGVLRPQPAGARLGGVARLQHGSGAHRHGRSRLSRALLPQAADQLRLVGQQGRPRGQQRLRGRLPRSRQYHRRSTAATRSPAGRSSSSRTPPAGWACSA